MDDFNGAKQINTGYGQPVFGKTELRDITISIAVLTLAFTIILCDNKVFDDFVLNFLFWILVSLILVICSFMLHEMAHKFTAQHFGAWSQYKMSPKGLILCLAISLLGILFAAPGAVYIDGYITKDQNGKISAAGPTVNVVLGIITLIIALLCGDSIICGIFWLFTYFNGFLAVFNMIPIPPLDGSKVIKWNVPVYIGIVACAILLIVAYYIL